MLIPGKPRPEPFSRPISRVEQWSLSVPRGRAEEVQLCVEGDGAIDPAALAAAVATASQACPGARLVRRGLQWVDSGRAPAVRLARAADFDRARLDSPLLRRPLARHSGAPSCEVILVLGTPTTVVFRAQHAVMDAAGAMLWQTQVFRALRGEAVEGATNEFTPEQLTAEVAAKHGCDLWLPPKELWFGPSILGPAWPRARQSMFRRRTIEGTHPPVTAKIARLVTACVGGEGRVAVPVGLRPYLPGLRTTGNAGGDVVFLVHKDEDWNDVHASLLTAINEDRYLEDLVPRVWQEKKLWWMRATRGRVDSAFRRKAVCDITASVSHLGAVDLADFCADGFEATGYYSLGCVGISPELNVVESQGRTELTVSWFDGPGVGERAEALLNWIADKLSPPAHRVWDGNRTDRTAPAATLTGLFAEQVRRTPDAVAVSGEDGDLTYAELSRRSAAVAAALRARGITRNDRVGLVAGRSAAAIVAIWGILRAGAAYLPIDAGYPSARIAQLLTDARAPVCLLESPGQERDFLRPGCEGVSLGSIPEPAEWHDVDGEPGDLANVIYTSGSTGAPKGVEIEHRSMVNYVRWVTREAGIDASTRMPLIASISFDMAGCAVFPPLLAGGTVLPVRDVNAVTLREVLEDGGANVLAITPSHLDLINRSGVRHCALRVVMTAGELLRRSTAMRARELFGPQCRILCQWGPTETTIVNTSHEFDPETDTDPGVPFGRPMDNNTVYLLDSHGRSVPPGEPGEAYVGGVQVARGYLGRPDLTRQRFIRLADGTRAYRTGDIARLLPSGELSFISRVDDQVKVAGHRVEPAEIAQVLEDHPAVRQAAVVPRSRPGRTDKELCGYVVGDRDIAPAVLTEFLAGRLPRYMIPAVIIAVDEIPRNANGKTDVRQLPDPFSAASGGLVATGRDDVTNAIASIWARTLQIDAQLIDEQTDFRQIGGNSILLLTMIEEVSRSVTGDRQAEFMGELGRLIREPTLGRVSGLARQVRAGQQAADVA